MKEKQEEEREGGKEKERKGVKEGGKNLIFIFFYILKTL